jgi:hypothetical protein
VREDYSPHGTAWDYFPHDHARRRAYRWGEDGLLGITDRECRLCFALALWNGKDPMLKERLFGLTGPEGNHGEDVKECCYYLDSTPTHSYLKALYKYPQAEFPYARLVEENRRRGRQEPEFELTDTGIFDGNRYFDVVAEYAKAAPEDILTCTGATWCYSTNTSIGKPVAVWAPAIRQAGRRWPFNSSSARPKLTSANSVGHDSGRRRRIAQPELPGALGHEQIGLLNHQLAGDPEQPGQALTQVL